MIGLHLVILFISSLQAFGGIVGVSANIAIGNQQKGATIMVTARVMPVRYAQVTMPGGNRSTFKL